MVVQGFDITNYSGIFSSLSFNIKMSNAVILHPQATGQGVGFYAFAGSEQDFPVTLLPNTTVYIEVDLGTVTSGKDVRAFWDSAANSGEGGEYSQSVDTVVELNLVISSNTTGFTAGRIPLYKVATNSSSAIAVTDCRPMMFRLGSGGSSPNPANDFAWPSFPDAAHARMEPPSTSTGYTSANAPWQGGDKNITSLKAFCDAVMTKFKELTGSPYWYMPNAAGGIPGAYQNAALTVMTGGTWEHNPPFLVTTGDTSAGSDQLTSLASVVDVVFGDVIAGPGIPFGTTVVSVLGSTVTMSANATANQTGITVTFAIPDAGELVLVGGSTIHRLGFANNLSLTQFPNGISLVTNPALYIVFPSSDIAISYGFGEDTTTPILPQAVSATSTNTISVAIGGNYIATPGNIMLRGQQFAYTAYAAGVFSGVTPDPSGIVQVGDYAYQLDKSGIGYYHFSTQDVVPGVISGISMGAEKVFWLAFFNGVNTIELKNGGLLPGDILNVGDTMFANTLTYIGSPNEAATNPSYVTTPTGALAGQMNYNSVAGEDLTSRISRLTAMAADNAQDRNVGVLATGFSAIVNTLSGANQLITFTGGGTLTFAIPGSANNAVVGLTNTLTLAANQAAYFSASRNAVTSITDLTGLTVANISAIPIDETTRIVAYRLGTTDIYLWDGLLCPLGELPSYSALALEVEQDLNAKLVNGGTWTWNSGTSTLSWGAVANIAIPGLADSVNNILAGSATLADGQAAYVALNRTGVGGNLTVVVAAESSVPASNNNFVIARRRGAVVYVGRSFQLVNGESKTLDAGLSDQNKTYLGISTEATSSPAWNTVRSAPLRIIPTDGSDVSTAVASVDTEIDKFFGQMRIQPRPGFVSQVTVSGVDFTMLDGSVLSQTLSNLVVSFTGAVIDFSTGTVYASDGVTPLGVNFTPFSVPVGQYFWYSVNVEGTTAGANNAMSLHVIVGKATAANAVLVSAPFAAFTGSKNLGQVAVQNVGGTITVNSVRQLGVGAGGSGIGQFFTGPVALTGSYTGDVIVYGDASLAGTSATITVNGNLTITGDLTNTGGNNLVVTGDMFVNSIDFEPSGATGVGNLTVDGDLNVSGTLAKISIVTDTVASAAMWMTGQITTTNDNSALVASGAIVTISNDPTYTGTVQNIFGNNVDCNPGFNINPTGATITFTTTDYYSVYAPTTSSSTSPSVITVGMNMISSRVWLASKDVSKSGGSINIGGDFNGQYINALSLEASIITTGSPGGTITIQGTCYNSSLNTNGATGSTAGYCSAGNITLGAFIGKAWNPGVRSIYAAGASISAAGDGGGGGAIKCSGPCYAQYLVTDGGAGYLGSGGGGGLITIMGELYCLHIQASGGNGGAGNGGSGGSLLFNSNVSISGNILFSGGSGTGNNSGGYAGYLTVGGDLVGVGSIQGNGGGIDQATNGAAPTSGASVTIYGNLTNVNSITLQGGSILSSVSGSQNAAIGGLLYVYGTTSSASGAGSIGVGGGNSTSGQGGKGGWLYFYAPISGLNLYANGGNSNAGSAKGGGGYVYVYMGGTVQTITTADGTTGTASTATTYIYLGGSVTVGSITAPNRANSAIRGVNAYNSILKVSSFTDLNQLTNHNGLNPITATSPQTDLYTYDATAACWCSLVQASSTPSTRNLIIAGSNFENNAVGGWQLFNVTLTSKIPTGAPTLGSATGMTVATTATNPISRGYSLQVSNTASANFAAGSGIISQAYSIDLLYQAKVLANTLAYRATTGAAFQSYNGDSSNTWAVYIYDVTNAAWIQPAGVYNLIQNSGVGNHSSTWQTPSNMTQFRIALVCITATTGSSPAVDTIQTTFDDFYAGPQSITQGMAGPVGEIISTGSITPDPGFLYCNGAAISRTQYSDLFSKIGTTYGVGDNSTTFNIPNLQGVFARGAGSQTITDGFGAIAHAATLGAAQNDMSQGHYHNLDATVTANIGQTNGLNIQYTNSAATGNYANVANNSGNRPAPQAQGMVTNGSSGTPRVGGETLPANVAVAYHIRYQASYQMSADTDTRVVAAILSGTPTGTIASLGAETIAKYPTVTRDSHSGYSASTGLYTVPVSGFYTVDASALITFSSGAAYLYGLIYQNGAVAVSQYYYASTASDGVARVHGDLYCIAGDTIGVHFASNGASPAFGAGAQNQFSIRRLSGPATIAASESVNVAYTNSTTPQTGINPNGSYILMSFPDKKIDSHGSWSGTTFTAKISGSFLVTGTVLLASTNILNNRYFACIHKNGTEFYRCTNITPPAGTDLGLAYSGIVPLLARETVQIYLYGAGNNSASTLSSGSGQVFITRVGN